MILEDGFAYDDDAGTAGDYICEHLGALHKPRSPDGCIMYAIVHGPLVGDSEDGGIAAIVDAKFMLEMARAAGVADHIETQFM